MRMIERSSKFKKDYKRELKGRHHNILEKELKALLLELLHDRPLPMRFRDHDLSGNWAGYRECHIKPDLLLIYRKVDMNVLRLARLGSHSELFS